MEQVEKIGSIWTWHIVTLSRMKHNLKVLKTQKKTISKFERWKIAQK